MIWSFKVTRLWFGVFFILLASCSASDKSDTPVNSSTSSSGTSSSNSSTSSSSSSSSSNSSSGQTSQLSGKELYKKHNCGFCHNDDAQKPEQPIVFENWNIDTLATRISRSMPTNNPAACNDSDGCARKVAEYVLSLAPQENCSDRPASTLPQRLRLLSNYEYANTINDLLNRNDGTNQVESFETDTIVAGFDNNAGGSSVTVSRMNAYWDGAETIAQTQNNMQSLLGCGQLDGNANDSPQQMTQCANSFVTNFGERAFRRPLTAAEETRYRDIFLVADNRVNGGRLIIQAMLSSPNFLYRPEIGTIQGNGDYQLDAYEIASLLSYTYWGTMPDNVLLSAAKNGNLNNVEAIRIQAEQMLNNNKAKQHMTHFAMQWLNIGNLDTLQRDTQLFPDFNPTIGNDLKKEASSFMQEVLLGNYKLADLFTANFTYLNNNLASFYGVADVNHNDFRKVTVNNQRGGILHLGALQASNASMKEGHPIFRGLVIRRNLLCQEFGIPPANIGEVEPLDPNKPLRERFAAHSNNATCASCHQHIDGLGYAFGRYTAVGQYQQFEGNNLNIDTSGTLTGIASMADTDTHDFNDLNGLASILANEGEQQTAYCLSLQFHRFMQGVAQPDSCEVKNTLAVWKSDIDQIKALFLEPLKSSQLLLRR